MEQKQSHRYREHFDGCQMGGDLGGWAKKVKGIEVQIGSYRIVSHEGVKHSIENIVNNTIITMCGVRLVQDLLG